MCLSPGAGDVKVKVCPELSRAALECRIAWRSELGGAASLVGSTTKFSAAWENDKYPAPVEFERVASRVWSRSPSPNGQWPAEPAVDGESGAIRRRSSRGVKPRKASAPRRFRPPVGVAGEGLESGLGVGRDAWLGPAIVVPEGRAAVAGVGAVSSGKFWKLLGRSGAPWPLESFGVSQSSFGTGNWLSSRSNAQQEGRLASPFQRSIAQDGIGRCFGWLERHVFRKPPPPPGPLNSQVTSARHGVGQPTTGVLHSRARWGSAVPRGKPPKPLERVSTMPCRVADR